MVNENKTWFLDFSEKGVSGNFASAEIGSFSFGRNRQN